MKVSIALDPSIDEYEILIRAPQLTEEIAQLQESILKQKLFAPLAFFYKDRSEYFLDLETLLFLKQMERGFMGIPRDEAYEVKQKSCLRLPFVGFPNQPLST